MKNQYFGDVNDFRKYGLLRVLTGCIDSQYNNKQSDLTIGVCWMLTPDDNLPHGNRTEYLQLQVPNIYNNLDHRLFRYLRGLDIPSGNNRDVKNARNVNCLPPTSIFYSEPVPSDRYARTEYFNNFLWQSTKCDIIFYDPDNGLNVMTRRYGTRFSPKYLYWCELSASYVCGHSILLYQHFGMQPGGRELFIKTISDNLKRSIGIDEIYSFRSAYVVFFLLPQPRHKFVFEEQIEYLRKNWSSNQEIRRAGFKEIKKH